MYRTRFAAVLTAAAAGLVLAACSDSSDSPTSPMVSSPATGAVISCTSTAFNNARNFARAYFVNANGVNTQNNAVAKIDAMQAASGVTRTERAFDVIAMVAAGTNVKAGEEAAGSSLMNFLAGCGGLGLSDPIDWTGALGPQGALAVVGTGANVSAPVEAEDLFSAVAPPGTKTWSRWLRLPDSDFPDPRAIVFGAPFNVTSNLSPEVEIGTRGFDWNVLPPRPFPFGRDADDDGFFGICVASATTERVQNNHPSGTSITAGILGTPDPLNDPIDLTCDGFQDNGQPVQNVGLFRRVMNALSPQPAYAAAALLTRKTGGTPGGFSRHFVVKPNALKVTIGTIRDAFVGADLNGTDGVKVTVTTIPPGNPPPAGVPLQSAEVLIDVAGNNGRPAGFIPATGLTNEFGEVVFKGLKILSAGGYTASATVKDGGLAGQAEVSGLSNQFHIKNKK
jgi:hypothetical protein